MLPGNKAEPHRTCKAGHSVVETCTFLIHSERSTVVIRLATAQPRWRTAAALSRHTPVTTQDLNLSESYQQVLHIFQSDVGRGSLGKRPARQRGWSTTEMQGKVVLLWRSSAQKNPKRMPFLENCRLTHRTAAKQTRKSIHRMLERNPGRGSIQRWRSVRQPDDTGREDEGPY
ncbi:hypothetical protein TGRUB_310650 [Toxoplasma gondii RUB]|uniref:Uncharacterized protein n=3 Tax=Toxoplasma gondii TaxID=5811 RepID=S7UTC7_TOXGG|nr:hypothetical protein TGGT1_310650 [Toxoplasma gondii GT1]KFG65835.1 hypothetical protein TGRUB_310650 [Toxoplasma gondii RUB]RQX72460.1 hypothetical protein TGCAST_310650 [Toxoplasma gondii CAST]